MKVLKQGSGQKGWSTKAICTGQGNGGGGCGAELLVDEEDLYQTSSTVRDETDYFVTFDCPECGVKTDLENPPRSLQDRVSEKLKAARLKAEKPRPPLKVRNSPISFFLGSQSKVKVGALQDAVNESQLNAAVIEIKGAESGVNEQPVGEVEILRGAVNRALSAWQIDPRGEAYFAIENGIELIDGEYVDYAIALFFVPKTGVIVYLKSEAVGFPLEFVEQTAAKEGGFVKNTVGKTLQEKGAVRFHDDPHLDLTRLGKSRRQILKETLTELFNYLPRSLFLKDPN
jgi:non-canonical (house-cleaning) NTP pyrophosphatase